jgi:NAD(P)-dependent dehydrogenase (short-subunit alcohol dehydrogenase family)
MSQNVAVVTGADRGLGFAMTVGLLRCGWRVIAGQFLPDWPDLAALSDAHPGRLTCVTLNVASTESVRAAAQQVRAQAERVDLLINNAGINPRPVQQTIREGLDYTVVRSVYDVNAVGPLRVTEALLPLMSDSRIKRLCFVSSEAGSVGRSHRNSWYAYCMSKAALNMAVSILFNDLRPEGYTFRLYHPGWVRSYITGVKATVGDMEPEEAAIPALAFFLSGLDGEPAAEPPYDEDHLVLRDWRGQEWPW